MTKHPLFAVALGIVVIGALGIELIFLRRSPFRTVERLTAAVLSEPGGTAIPSPDTLRDPKTLDSLLFMLQEGRWRRSWHTLPSSQYSVRLLSDTTLIGVIHICRDCIVGVFAGESESPALVRTISDGDGASLSRWFGVQWPLAEMR